MRASERLAWAAGVVAPAPADRVLEVGCGHGVLLSLLADLGAAAFDVVVSLDVRAFWTPPAPEWDVVDRVLAPGGRVVVAFSVMGPGADDRISTAVHRLAAERGFTAHARHRAATAPTPSGAIELRTGGGG